MLQAKKVAPEPPLPFMKAISRPCSRLADGLRSEATRDMAASSSSP